MKKTPAKNKTTAKKPIAKKSAPKKKLGKLEAGRQARLDKMLKMETNLSTKEKDKVFSATVNAEEPVRLEPVEVEDLKTDAPTVSVLNIKQEMEDLKRYASLLQGTPDSDCPDCAKDSDGLCDFCHKASKACSYNVVLETIDTLSPITTEINAAHKQLIAFEKIYASLKAKQVVTKRTAERVLEENPDDEKRLTDSFYEELHAKHKFMMVEKIVNCLHTDFRCAPLKQEEIRSANLQDTVASLVRDVASPKPVVVEEEKLHPLIAMSQFKLKKARDEMAKFGSVGMVSRARR